MNIVIQNPKLFTSNLLRMERSGRYEEAISTLKTVWEDMTKPPIIDGLTSKDSAELILRCGSLIGYLGHVKQIPNSQEKAKNLLTDARNRFLSLYEIEKISECENYLALAYWRSGESVEAQTWIDEALSHKVENSSEIRLHSYLIRCLIFLNLQKYKENVSLLEPLEKDYVKYACDSLIGDYYNLNGVSLKNLGYFPKAENNFKQARKYHKKSGHKIYLGTIENNLAQLYREHKDFDQSHEAVDNALKIYDELKDRTRKGSSLDTKANIYFDEGKYNQALKTIDESIRILRNSENAAYLVESFQTKAKILVFMDEIASASLCLSEGVTIAQTQISKDAAENLAKEFELAIRKKSLFSATENIIEEKPKTKSLELVLHPSLSKYENYQAIRIQNNHLADIGLQKGSLALVVKDEEIQSGDLIALTEIETDATICGYFDSYFGMVALEGISSEPILYQIEEIRILGKIVGCGNPKSNSNGKVHIKPLKI